LGLSCNLIAKREAKKVCEKTAKTEPGGGMTFGGNGARLAQGLGKKPDIQINPLVAVT
jgi:hypothetical protein